MPLTNEQRHLLEYTRLHRAGVHTRFLHFETWILGPLDVDRLRRSLDAVAQRHESLRTRIVICDGTAVQHIDDTPHLSWELIDHSHMTQTMFEEHVAEQCRTLLNESVDLSKGPLLAARVFRLSYREHVFIVALSHVITDMMSNAILNREIWTVYGQDQDNVRPPLPATRFQYADYAVWEQRTYDDWFSDHGKHWKLRLSGAQAVRMPLERDYKRPHDPKYASKEICFGGELSDKLRALAKSKETSLALVVLAVYLAAMSYWCSQRDLLVGFTSHSRFCPALLGMVGNLAMGLTLRIQLRETDTYADLLDQLGSELLSAYEHWDFNRVPDFVPLVSFGNSVFFDWIPTIRGSRSIATAGTANAEVKLRPFPLKIPAEASYVALFSETTHGVVAMLAYEVGLFRPATIETLERHMRRCANEIVEHPRARVSVADCDLRAVNVTSTLPLSCGNQ